MNIMATDTIIINSVIRAIIDDEITPIILSIVVILNALSGLIGSNSLYKKTLFNLLASLIELSTILMIFLFATSLLFFEPLTTNKFFLITFPW